MLMRLNCLPSKIIARARGGERLACPDIKDSVVWTVEGFPLKSELLELIDLAGGKSSTVHHCDECRDGGAHGTLA